MAQMPDLIVVCKNCGNEVSPYITECPYCGNRLRKRAPKIERDGTVSEPRKARKARKPAAPRLSRFRSGRDPRHPRRAHGAPVRDADARRPLALRLPAALPDCAGRHRRRGADRRPVVAAWRRRPSCTRTSGTSWPRSPPSRSSAGCWSAATGRSWSSACSCCAGWAASRWRSPSIRRRWPSAATARRSACCARGPSPTSWRAAAARNTTATCSAPRSSRRCCCSCRWRVVDASAIAGFAGGAAGLLVGLGAGSRARLA